MQVTAGHLKGHSLIAPKTERVRPAAAKVRAAIFNILGNLEGLDVLDLFAGSGSVGIEAISRGAKFCCFVEKDRSIAACIDRNLNACRVYEYAKVLVEDARMTIRRFHRQRQAFDLVFVDPPYDKRLVQVSLKILNDYPILKKEGTVIVEHSPRELPKAEKNLEIIDQRVYGQTFITFLRSLA